MKRNPNSDETNCSRLVVAFCSKKVHAFLILIASVFFVFSETQVIAINSDNKHADVKSIEGMTIGVPSNIYINNSGIETKYDDECIALASSNSPVCVGSTLNLYESGGTATSWSWTGPNGFTSSLQNPVILNATTANSGVYTVVISNGACTSSSTVIVSAEPIVVTGCPDDIVVCADSIKDNVFGAYVDWPLPKFELNCLAGLPGGSSTFIMLFELPEVKWKCWEFNQVQRVGINTGFVNLWQSTGLGDPYILSPSVYIDPPLDVTMDIFCDVGISFSWDLYLERGTTETYINSIAITPGLHSYSINIPSSIEKGLYRLKFGFSGNGNNKCYVDNLYFDGILMDLGGCIGGIDFNVTGPIPGFFPVGDSGIVYTATYTSPTGTTITQTCEFNVKVEGITAQVSSIDNSSCSLNNGTVTVSAQSSSLAPELEYSIDGGAWVSFGTGNTQETIGGFASGTYLINIRDVSLILDCKTIEPITVTIGAYIDTELPLITCPSNSSIEGCSTSAITGLVYSESLVEISASQFTAAGGTASDNCGIVYYSYQDSKSGSCPIVVSRVFTVKDLHGNAASCTQTINIDDVTAPVFQALTRPYTIYCPAVPVFAQAVAIDNCDESVTLSYADVTTAGACAGNYSVTRTWTATDDCSNSSSSSQTIIVVDNSAPVIEALPGPSTISCPAVPVFAQAAASDACGSAFTLTYNDVKTDGQCAGNYSVTRTWTATDGCGNSSQASQTINVQDISAPVITALPETSVINCPAVPVFAQASASDECGSAFDLTYNDVTTAGACTGNYSVTRTWTASDACGNSSQASQTIIVRDISAPVIAALPAPSIIDCPAVPVFAQATAIDECSSAFDLTYSDVTTAGACAGNYSVTRTWTAIDACGNSSQASQIINVQDITAPAIVCPAIFPSVWPNSGPNYIQSGSSLDATATDNCSAPIVLYTLSGATTGPNNLSTLDGVTFNYGATLVTWTATDACGNTSSCMYTIHVSDNTPPIINCPSTISVACSELIPAAYATLAQFMAAGGSVSDNTGINTLSFMLLSQNSNGLSCPETITRIYQIADIIGNTATCTQLIIVNDTIAPVIEALPEPLVINCPAVPVFAQPNVSDNCESAFNLTFNDVKTDGQCTGNYSVTRTWTATDACGNSSQASQTINVQDISAPVIAALPEPSLISCPAVPVFAQATAIDECGSAFTLTYNDVTTGGQCAGNYSVTRTWTATDACGNSSQASQTINVQDITAPVIAALPEPSLISCPAVPVFAQATASDECGSAFTLTYVDVTTNGACAGSYSVNRYWTATDDCGNTSYAIQTINVQDITAPVIAALPPPRSISCPAEPAFVQTTASDECNSAFTLTYVDVKTRSDCAGSYSVTRTWTATDGCGNSSQASQTINVQDVSAPVIAALPGPSTINCPAEPVFAQASALDECESEFALIYHDVLSDGQCKGSYSVTRTWTATDACGNSSQASQTINVQDVSAPVIAALPAASLISCPAEPVFAQATAIDECFSAFTLTYNDVTTTGQCAGNYSKTRTWTATDACGNSSSASQTINVQDISAPVIAALPAPSIIDCPAVPVFAQATASDECGSEFALAYLDVIINGQCAGNYSVTRIWTARDGCGNVSHASQTINVQDITAPVITCPANITVNNDPGMDGANVIVPQPGYFEACGSVILSNSFNLTDNASGYYPVGTTSVVWTATDDCGNSSSCTMTITVIDNEGPVITCPPDIIHCSTDFTLGAPIVSDNSGIASITNDAPLIFPIGVTTIVTWTITDIHGNISICTQSVTISKLVVSAEGSSQVSCNNVSDGSITVTTSGGTGSYSYSLDGIIFGPSNQFNDLLAGSYTVTVKDSIGCIAITNAVVISNPDLLIASATGSSQVSCHNSSDGSVTASASGGTGSYSYSLNGGAFGSSSEFIGLPAGSYSVTVMDENECIAVTEALVIANPDLLIASATGSSQVSCHNSSDGSITVSASGGTGSYSYSLNGGAFGPASEFIGLPAGSYIITVMDENNCTAVTEAFVIENPVEISIAVVSTPQVNCNNDSDGVIIAVAHGGTGNFVYALNGGAYQQSNVFDNLQAGNYIVTVMDENGCTDSSPVIVIINPEPVSVETFIVSGNSCFGEADASVEIYSSGGTPPFVYSLDGAEPTSNSLFSNITAGNHDIVVYDINGCKGIGAFNIEAQAELLISLVSSSDANCVGKSDGSIEVTGVGGVPPYTYLWSTGDISPLINGLDAGEYTITVTDINGCISISTQTVKSGITVENLTISTAFSPNGDGINDLWTIHNLELYPDNEVTVINRWGNEVYTQKVYQSNWDGSDLAEGTYFYILKCKMCGETREFKGYITIVR